MVLSSAAIALGCYAMPVWAEDGLPPRCVDISIPKSAIAARDGKWVELTREQWEFTRGVFAMDPLTEPGLPVGSEAVLATVDDKGGGLIFFVDGVSACQPMAVPREMIDLIEEIKKGTIHHDGDGL
jgi:hypothetical protein